MGELRERRRLALPVVVALGGTGWIALGFMPRASPVMENLRAWVRYPTARPWTGASGPAVRLCAGLKETLPSSATNRW